MHLLHVYKLSSHVKSHACFESDTSNQYFVQCSRLMEEERKFNEKSKTSLWRSEEILIRGQFRKSTVITFVV